MKFLVRFCQVHETFRIPELQALATLEGIAIDIISYDLDSPFCIIAASDCGAAARLIKRSILAWGIYEYWGSGKTLEELHESVKQTTKERWPLYETCSFKFNVDSFQGSRAQHEQVNLINSFSYLDFKGPISLKKPDVEFTLFEHWLRPALPGTISEVEPSSAPEAVGSLSLPSIASTSPVTVHFGRLLATSSRALTSTYDLKKRRYISTTSMDSELALVTANLALAAPGKLVFDPFVGTGSFPVACAHFGAIGWGSDIDGRALRGESGKEWLERIAEIRAAEGQATSSKTTEGALGSGENGTGTFLKKKPQNKERKAKTLRGNFEQYSLLSKLGDVFTSDLTNSPIRRHSHGTGGPDGRRRLFDAIVCDPPYGVREGLRVLGQREVGEQPKAHARYKEPDFIAPKRPYSFLAMLDDILHFASETIVDDGRLSFWMPMANDEDQEIPVPAHPGLSIVSVCVQPFNKWSRRLITYRKLPDQDVDEVELQKWTEKAAQKCEGVTADELNPFRKNYFAGFQTDA